MDAPLQMVLSLADRGRGGAQGIAADVAGDGDLQLVEHVEETPMGAAGAEHRGPDGQGLVQLPADRKSTRLNSSHNPSSRMPSSA